MNEKAHTKIKTLSNLLQEEIEVGKELCISQCVLYQVMKYERHKNIIFHSKTQISSYYSYRDYQLWIYNIIHKTKVSCQNITLGV